MSPEQALGRGEAGTASDGYSLGAILYEMLTGRPPFRGETAAETERQVLHDEPVRPSLLNPRTPRDLETICLKCLQKAPGHRYETAVALADDFDRFLRGEPIRARRIGLIERAGRWMRRHTAATISAGALLVALLTGLAVLVWIIGSRAQLRRALDQDLADSVRHQRDEDWPAARDALARARG